MDYRTARYFLVGVLVGIVVAGAVGFVIVVNERNDTLAAFAEAQRISDHARTSYERLSVRLGNIIVGLDGALKEVNRIGNVVDRLRARDEIYQGVAKRIREVADGLDHAGGDPKFTP
jgi:hypothetical protein